MLKFGDSAAHAARRAVSGSLLALLSAAVVAGPDVSSPTSPTTPATDPVARFLVETGLLNVNAAALPLESAFVGRLRDKASDMVLTAMNFLGVPYRRGGNHADHGFDCSGFTRQVFEMSLGLVLPRRADEQATAAGLMSIRRNELKPGDLVFFNTLRRTFSHVGIYVGEGRFIHAPRPGGEVRVEDMGATYWSTRFTGARRADPGPDGAPAGVAGPAAPLVPADQATLAPLASSPRNVY